ncbi:hypothetical protein ACOJTA_10820 [Malaciobacter sp. WC5094]
MKKKSKDFLHITKSRIGLVHASLACIGAVVLSFLTTMLLSSLINGDYAIKIVPSMILTPILMSFYGIWLLFCKTRIQVIKKSLYMFIFLICSLIISLKVF